jgi:hypothetical protein
MPTISQTNVLLYVCLAYNHKILEDFAKRLNLTKTACAEMLINQCLNDVDVAIEDYDKQVAEYQARKRQDTK